MTPFSRFLLLGNCLLAHWCAAESMSESFDAASGAMDVDYGRYLARHDVVFNRPITIPAHGSTVGNGRVGAMVWNTNGFSMQVSGVDASEESAFAAGLIRLYTTPSMDTSYAKFQQRLSLYDGVLTIHYDPDRTITVMGSANSEVLGIHVADARAGVTSVTLDLSIWDVRDLNGGDVPDRDAWRTISTEADPAGIRLSRGQRDPGNFGYTLAATVQGASFTSSTVDANTTRLSITPTSSYTIWIACASRWNAPQHDSLAQAALLLRDVQSRGYRTTLANYENWWHSFWQRSFIHYSDSAPDGDYLENLYYLYTYVIAAGSYANHPFHFINGAFSASGDSGNMKWSVAYWYWNQRDIYASFLASNHPELLHVFNEFYARNSVALATHTHERYGIDGIWVPEVMRWDGDARHAEESSWTKDILSTGAEAAESMYAEYTYTNNIDYLKSTVYPFVRAVSQFYAKKLTLNTTSGKYYMARSNAHETYWDVQNAITDLAAIRSLFPIAILTSRNLGLDAPLRDLWRAELDNLAPYPVSSDGSRYAPHDPPSSEAHNGENITSELIWPYGVTGIDAPDYQMALNGWLKRPFPYSDIWSNDAVQAARLGLGDEVLKGLKLLTRTFQNYPNGLSNNTNGRFEYLGTHLSAINESLLQSYGESIRVFPALPTDPQFVGKFTLMANGGFLVTSEYENLTIKYVAIKSLYGKSVVIENPWGTGSVKVTRLHDGEHVLSAATRRLTFPTESNAVYLIERIGSPFGRYRHAELRGQPNNDAKRLAGTSSMLGDFSNEARPIH